jgi:hypothetical protein
MRTTLTLEEDVASKAKRIAVRTDRPFKHVVNAALRLGLEQLEKPLRQKRHRTVPHAMGLREGLSLDNVQELLAQLEGEHSR